MDPGLEDGKDSLRTSGDVPQAEQTASAKAWGGASQQGVVGGNNEGKHAGKGLR